MTTESKTVDIPASDDYNGWANWWFNVIGCNVIPAAPDDESKMKPLVEWKNGPINYQDNPVSDEQHKEWMQKGLFKNGFAIIMGKLWRGRMIDCYIGCVDRFSGKPYTWECVTIVEQRGQRQHVYICAETPLRDKTNDASTRGAEISSGEIPAIEVKGSSKFLMFPTPNAKKNGDRYQILDTRELKFFKKEKKKLLEEYLNDICKKYDIKYFENYQNNNGQIPISELYSGNSKIPKGHNRHGGLLRVMSSMIIRNYATIPLETLKEWCMDLNVKAVCEEPLSDKEFAKEWQQALRWGPVREKMEEVEKKSRQSQVRE